MKKEKDKKVSGKTQKSSLKAVAATAILAGSLLVPTPSLASAGDNKRSSIRERVKAVRTLLQEKLAANDSELSKLSYSETELTQWGNWGKWNNWGNWNNWNNWANWGNWGNWGNR